MADNKKMIIALIFIALAVVSYIIQQNILKNFIKQYTLYEIGKVTCKEKDLADDPEFEDGQCVSFLADFVISDPLCPGNILSESICKKCITIEQEVNIYAKVQKQVCTNSRTGKTQEFEMDDVSEEATEARNMAHADSRAQTCTTQTKYEWRSSKSPDDGHVFHFPTSNEEDHGKREFTLKNTKKLKFVDKTDYNNSFVVYMGNDFANHVIGLEQPVPISVWTDDEFYTGNKNRASSEELCISYSEASIFKNQWATNQSGFTNAEFRNLPHYGNHVYYPQCEKTHSEGMPTGTYRVRATCKGKPSSSKVRVVGGISKNVTNSGDLWVLNLFKPSTQLADDNSKILIWQPNAEMDMVQAIGKAQQTLMANTTRYIQICYAFMAGFGLIALLLIIMAMMDDGGKRSRHSSESS